MAGQQFEYAFDDIGNRRTAASGGDQWGANLRFQNYTPNALNQYSQRTVPGALDVQGSATNTATVTVNNQPTYRKDDYFRAELSVDNAAGPLWQGVTNVAVLPQGTNADIVTNFTGNVLVPPATQTFSHDADGNLTNDGVWAYTWDAENRLLSMTSLSAVPAAGRQALQFGYDFQGRRISKVVSNWTGAAWSLTLERKFLYEGWNLLAEMNGGNGTMRQYLWGTDLSGSRQGAGGVGGLVKVFDVVANVHYFPAYDGNGNVAALIRADTGTVEAEYEYGPYGELLRASGTAAAGNPFRFSTKYQDDETGFLYYGYRYYLPSVGRWLSRDPIGERGGMNLYGFVGNSPLNKVDHLGLDAAIINHGGYTGHTSFVIINPDGSVTAYHFYAKSHQTGRCCGLGSLLAVCCDSVSVWQESANSLQDYMASQEKLGGGAKIAAYAFGTPLDDQLSIEDLNEQDKADAGIYSLALGIECHKKSWDWFNEYLEGGQQVYPTLLPGQQPPPYWPERWFETRRHRQESLPQVPAPPSPAPAR